MPFYLRTGKRLPKRASEVAIQFKDVPHVLFNDHPDVPLEPTVLSLRVQPEEGLSMRIASKLPGPKVRIYPVKMEFNYSSSFGGTTPEAYERLLLDVMAGDATLFMRRDAVESAWQFVMPILDHWEQQRARDICRSTSAAPGARSRPTASSSRTAGSGGRYDGRSCSPSDPEYLVPLRDVERTLARQMKALQGPGAAPVQRARMSNLVIFCNSLEQAIQINAQIPEIEAVHPARALLLVGEPGGEERDVTARVTVRPVRTTGGRAHACAEQVTLHAAGAAVERLPFAVRALVIGDLPTNLWWAAPQPPPLAGPLLYDLSENAQQIMYDSLGWRGPGARRVGHGVVAGADRARRRRRPLARGVRPQLAAAEILAAAADAGARPGVGARARPSR